MSIRDALLVPDAALLPVSLREPIRGVSLSTYLFVEAARLDAIPLPALLAWLGVKESAFAGVEEQWNDRIAVELEQEGARFDELYEDLIGRALSSWARRIDPLDGAIEAWMMFQRHALSAADSNEMVRRAGLTPGDEVRLTRLWHQRLTDPEIAARAARAWVAPLEELPALIISPFVFPPPAEPA